MKEQFRKLYRKITFLNSDLEITKEIYSDAMKGFTIALRDVKNIELEFATPAPHSDEPHPSSPGATPSQSEELEKPADNEDLPRESQKRDKIQRKIFRQIARDTHPDRLTSVSDFERDLKKKLFDKARIAMQEGDFYTLAYVAKKLEIPLPEVTTENLNSMHQFARRVEQEIYDMKNTYPWHWHHRETEEGKKQVLEAFIDSVNNSNSD